ncbi:MAG: transglycosylase SLT domain-containing protein [Burkholderiales bacterium]|nr:transglycosylase SLT domain-containing protein [Burkholderiales bacterium]
MATDEPVAETEIVDVRALTLVPASPAPRQFLLPRPHLPLHEAQDDPGSAHVLLGDIPFNAAPAASTSAKSLWARLRGSFALAELPSPLVKDWENWYATRPDYMARMIQRSERYLFYVVEEVEKRGMPGEIALLPMIESAYNPNAYSTAHASGMWQFIPSTGKTYGLKQNWWQDERRDVLAATRAALDYLEKLYEMFGSWELALASYNWGEGAVGRAIQRNEARGMRGDYLSLDMPAETRNYIPKLMAVKNLIARPEAFGIALAEIENQPYFSVVNTDRHIDVTLAAKLAEMPLAEFQALNPSHNRPVIRADVPQSILLPADRAERFQTNLATHGKALTSWQSYTLNKDDRLERIAQRFGIALAKLKEINSIPARLRSLSGLTILVPNSDDGAGGDPAAAGFTPPAIAERIINAAVSKHVVKAGETLAAIAQRYRVSMSELASRNGIRNGKLLIGQTLAIAETLASNAPAAAQRASSAKPAGTSSVKTAAKANAKVKHTASGRTQVAYAARRD